MSSGQRTDPVSVPDAPIDDQDPPDDLEHLPLGKKVMRFFGPFSIVGVVVLILYALLDRGTLLVVLSLMGAYMVPPAGKETIIPAAILALDIHFLLISLAVAFVDIVTALFLVYNFDYIRKVPILGPWIDRFENTNARVMKRKRWIRDVSFLGLALFVMFPFQGSGGVGGSILGRVIGLRPWSAFLSISTGALVGCLLIGYISHTVGNALFESLKTTEARIATALIALSILIAILLILRRNKRRKIEELELDEEVTDDQE